MRERIEKALDKVRPMLAADGGNVELIDVTSDGGFDPAVTFFKPSR